MKRVVVLLLLSLVMVSLVFAGGQQEAETETAEIQEGFNWQAYEGARINVIVNKHPWVELIEPKIPEFEEMTGIEVSLDIYPEDQFRTKRTVEMVSGTSVIDVFMMMPGNSLAQYETNGWVEPLNPFFNNENMVWPKYDLEDFYDSALGAGERNGKNYTIPLLLETSLLAYNKKILDKYGVEVPQTMEELEEAARTIYEESDGETYGITLRGKRAAATSQWVDFLHSFGGDWLDDQGKAAIDSPEAIEATEFYGKLLREYGPRSAPSNSWYESISLFQQGEAAMIYDASVFRPNYEDPESSQIHDSVGYAVIPEGPAGRVPHISNWGLAIYSGSENKEASWLFIQWATSKAIALESQLEGIPSARASAWDDPEFKEADPSPEWTQASIKSYELASPIWNPPVINVGEARDAAGSVIVAGILGEDVEAAAKEAAKEMNSILEDE